MLKIILSMIFILICVALTVVVLLQEGKSAGLWRKSAEWLILTGEKTRDVPWKAICRSLLPLQQLHLWYWQLF